METTQFSSNINMTGFQASTSLEEGLKKTIQHEFLKDNYKTKVLFDLINFFGYYN